MQSVLKKSKYKIVFIILLLSIMVFLSWITLKTLTATVVDSSWNGDVATSFKSGTGTEENPYVISSAGEFAYFRNLLSGDSASLYADKNYIISNSFSLKDYDMTINNQVSFTGTIDGTGNIITDITINDSLFVVLDNASIKNLIISNITYNKTKDNGGILAQETKNTNIDLVYVSLKNRVTVSNYAGIAYKDTSSHISNLIVDLKNTNDNTVSALFNNASNTTITKTYINTGINAINTDEDVDISVSTYDNIQNINTTNLSNSNYQFSIENNKLVINIKESSQSNNESISLHESGVENNILYVNDLDSDFDYYTGLNYSRQGNGRLPNGQSTDTYNETNMVKVYIHYSGKDVNDDTIVGYMNSNIRISELYYYKYLPVENGNVVVELIDNPFADRPYNKAFNGWVTDYAGATISYDWEIYTRFVTIPVENVSTPIEINMNATWTKASVITSTSSISSNINNTFKTGMVEYQNEVERTYGDVSNYYVVEEIDYGEYFNKPQGGVVYEPDGSRIWNDMCTDWWYGCEYLVPSPSGEYDPNKTYYNMIIPNNNYDDAITSIANVPYTERIYNPISDMTNVSGNYQKVTVSRNGSITGLYDSNGKIQSGTCTSNSCTLYKLLQNTDTYNQNNSYYYLATRDTNIFAPSGNLTSSFTISKPMTITGLNNGNLYSRTLRSTLTVNSDLRIENISFTASSLSGRSNNVKIGMNVSTSSSCQVQGSYSNSASNYRRYKTVVESGNYSNIFSTTYGSNYNSYGDSTTIVGNDYDRVRKVNNNLTVSTRVTPGQQSYVYGRNKNLTTDILNHIIIKSGSIGTTETSELTAGIYLGILGGGGINVATDLKVEGGYVVKIIGGVSRSTSWEDKNFAYINVTGGTVDSIIGGASYGTTQGNRIISITGGNITYSVFGGSNGAYLYSNSYTAALESSTFINVGGHANIGTTTSNLVYSYGNTRYPNSTVEPGSIFGAGNGKTDNLNVGKVYNSVIVVNGEAKINGNIYGGGNNGRIGLDNGGTSSKIIINSGNIKGSVYAGGNNNGAGSSSEEATTSITINGGTIENSVYGGSRTSGTVYGNSSVIVNSGTINKNVYGGGEGNSTYLSKNANVTIGSNTTIPNIDGSVYGGSAFGTVNSTSTNGNSLGNTTVTVNSGIIKGSVFGGGEGNNSYTPYVLGNITININGGDISNVYGGHDQKGSHTKQNKIYLNNGIVGNVYGGGNKSSVTNTNVTLNGSNVTTIYGGSNISGNVTTSTINLDKGTVGIVYGGNNAGGLCTTTNVTADGTAKITNSIYGGGNEVSTVTSNINLKKANGTIPNIYGGGKSSDTTTSNITNDGVSAGNIFGGSNLSGIVNESHLTNNNGTVNIIYGGNNAGGNTLISYINVDGGTINTIYGGGNSSGNNSSNITLTGGTTTDVYGGSNNSGKVTTTNLTIKAEASNVYGGGNLAEVGTTNIIVDEGTVGNIYGGGNLASVEGDTTITIKDSTINTNVYGGGNFGEVEGSSNVKITDTTVLGSIYGGGNGETAILKGDTNVSLDGKTIVGTTTSVAPTTGSVFGGGNSAYTGTMEDNNSLAKVNIAGAKIYGNVYGGANTSVIYGNTELNIGIDTIEDKTLSKDDIYIKGHVFGGGEANAEGSEIYDWYFISVTQGTSINVDANNYTNFDILGSFYGGGNASSASGDSYLYLNNYGASQQPKNNISIQRVTSAVLNNSSVVLKGAIDRANDYDTELFSISRVNNLTLKNNSELYLVTGTNLLENFKSVDSNDNLATVDIDENGNVTKNVDNRVYVYEGKNVNIAHDQQVTEYGKVSGMSFFGLFSFNYDDSVNTGNYHPRYTTGDELSWAGAFTRGSYILGSHDVNHDITKNGFYSNFMNEDTLINEVKYIEPTPTDAKFYMWFIGENVIEYNVNLTASKYSTLGSLELSFLEFTDPNTSFEVLNFDSSELAEGINLVDKSDIPRIAPNENAANNTYGLSMEASNVGWLTNGKTSFYTANPNISGTTYYEGENSTNVPTMLFYLYHSKNITEEKDLGTARISVMAITKKSAISSEIKRLVINVNMSTALYQTVEYEGAMTPGDKYELFTSTSNNLTTKSKFSAYYALYGENTNLYKDGYHRVLTSTFVLPVNTKITMIDFANHQTNYYYHVIDENDVQNATAEYQLHNEASYPLSLFTKMGSKENTDNYKDSVMNAIYYDGTNSSEEFIFIVDLSNTNISEDKLNNKLLIEIRDKNEQSIITVLGIQHSQLTYNLYHDKDSVINTTITPSNNPLYIGYSDIFDLNVDYHNESLNGNIVEDTQYFNSKLGVQIKIVSKSGKVMSGTDLVGTYFEMDGVKYYPDIYGTTHIKLSDKVGNTEKWLIFNTDNSSLPTGSYDFIFETFGSLDGIYYGESAPDYKELNINVINSEYGLNPVIDDESVVFDSNNEKELHYTINYESLLENPNIRLALYRRKYDTIYSGEYELVDLQNYLKQTLFSTENEYEYLLIRDPNPVNKLTLLMNDSLLSGTYRLAFRLYDDDVLIGTVIRYIVVKEGS